MTRKRRGTLFLLLTPIAMWLSVLALAGCIKRDTGKDGDDENRDEAKSGSVLPGPTDDPHSKSAQTEAGQPPASTGREPESRTPSASHLAFWTSVTPEKGTAFTATASSTSWLVKPVVTSTQDNRYGGRLALQVNAEGQQLILLTHYQMMDLNRPHIELLAATESDDVYSFNLLTRTDHPDVISLVADSAPTSHGIVASVIVNHADGASQLKFVRLADSQAETLDLDVSTDPEGLADVGMGAEHDGHHAVVYIKNGELAHGLIAGAGWVTTPKIENIPGCQSVQLIAMDTTADGSIFVASSCNVTVDNVRKKCVLNVAFGHAGQSLDFQTLATVDPEDVCRPFASDRPDVRVDGQGNAHIVYRQRLPTGQWQIDYVTGKNATSFSVPKGISEPGNKVNFPRCDVDANGTIAISWLDQGRIWMASGPSGDRLVKAPMRTKDGQLILAAALGGLTSGHPR